MNHPNRELPPPLPGRTIRALHAGSAGRVEKALHAGGKAWSRWRRWPLLLPLLLSLFCCSPRIKGDFGWSTHRRPPASSQAAENGPIQGQRFRLQRKNIFFYSDEIIWWLYQIREGIYDRQGFAAVLYKNDIGAHRIEKELRQATLLPGDPYDSIRHAWHSLEPGHYLLQIAYHSEPFDQAQFFVANPEREPLPDIWQEGDLLEELLPLQGSLQ